MRQANWITHLHESTIMTSDDWQQRYVLTSAYLHCTQTQYRMVFFYTSWGLQNKPLLVVLVVLVMMRLLDQVSSDRSVLEDLMDLTQMVIVQGELVVVWCSFGGTWCFECRFLWFGGLGSWFGNGIDQCEASFLRWSIVPRSFPIAMQDYSISTDTFLRETQKNAVN